MSLRTWLASRFSPRAAGVITAPSPYWFIQHPWLKEAGVIITAETAAQVSAVYGCCRLIVDSLAPAPITVTEIQKEGVRKALPDDSVAYTLNYGAPVDKAPDAPTSQAIEEALYWSALLHGNGYAEIQRDVSGRFFALWPIQSERVTPWRDETGFYYRVTQPTQGGLGAGPWARLEPKDMFHVRGPSLYGWLGDSPVVRAAKAIGIAQAAQVFSAAYFANGTVISGLITSEKAITQKQADDAKAKWTEEHSGGPAAQHGISVLGQGLKYEPLNHNAQESQLIEARRFQVHEIARFFGVPTTLLADNEAWTNLSELYLGFYRNALRPWAERFDAEATRKLFPQRQPWREVKHDLTHLTLGSFKDQVAACAQAVNDGLWTRNEARAVFGKNSVPDGDVIVVGSAVKSLEDALEPPKPPAPPMLPAPKAPDEDDDEDEEKPPERERLNLAREAVTSMFSDAFARHTKRIANLKTQAKRDLTGEERTKYRARLVDECASALALAKRAAGRDTGAVDLATFMDAIDAGEPPEKAAERLVGAIWGAP